MIVIGYGMCYTSLEHNICFTRHSIFLLSVVHRFLHVVVLSNFYLCRFFRVGTQSFCTQRAVTDVRSFPNNHSVAVVAVMVQGADVGGRRLHTAPHRVCEKIKF